MYIGNRRRSYLIINLINLAVSGVVRHLTFRKNLRDPRRDNAILQSLLSCSVNVWKHSFERAVRRVISCATAASSQRERERRETELRRGTRGILIRKAATVSLTDGFWTCVEQLLTKRCSTDKSFAVSDALLVTFYLDFLHVLFFNTQPEKWKMFSEMTCKRREVISTYITL